jgi:hypothetical protein
MWSARVSCAPEQESFLRLVGCGKRRLFAGLTNAKLARRLVRWLFLVEKPKTSYRASPKFPARCELDIFILLE